MPVIKQEVKYCFFQVRTWNLWIKLKNKLVLFKKNVQNVLKYFRGLIKSFEWKKMVQNFASIGNLLTNFTFIKYLQPFTNFITIKYFLHDIHNNLESEASASKFYTFPEHILGINKNMWNNVLTWSKVSK